MLYQANIYLNSKQVIEREPIYPVYSYKFLDNMKIS